MVCLLSLITLFSVVGLAASAAAKAEDDKLQVHLIMHTHDDPGWLKTADQYYTGANASVYLASVQYIFDSVVTELGKDADRHFTFCEISFLSRWYFEQTLKTKETFKRLVKNGQITIVNGGWVMHDEAASHYVSMIDQTTLGHKFLKDEFNYLPRVGWQIDPFGHSNTHAWLSSAVGFDSLFFGRIDYQDRAKRMAEKNMEMVWKGSASDPDQAVFTGAFTSGNYGPPSGYCFDTSCHYCRDDPVVDSPYLEDNNVDSMVNGYIQAILTEHQSSRGNHIMLEVGADFTGDNSHTWFKNMDKLIERIHAQDDRFHIFYSDPLTYTKARATETDIQWTVKTDDFFPYSDHEHAFWAGYFTSRPTLKYFERTASSLLQTFKQLTASPTKRMRALRAEIDRVLFQLTAAVGLVNHHDAITGTSKQHVADDYVKILAKAVTSAEALIGKVYGASLLPQDLTKGEKYAKDVPVLPTVFTMCRLYNESICTATQSLQAGETAVVSVYNPLPRARTQQVTLPLNTHARVSVFSVGETALVTSDLLANQNQVTAESAPYSLVFSAQNVPALGSAVFLVRLADKSTVSQVDTPAVLKAEKVPAEAGPHLTVSSDQVTVTFNAATGLLESITRLDVTGAEGKPLTAQVSQDFAYYKSFGSPGIGNTTPLKDTRDPHLKNIQPLRDADSVNNQPGGAYLMRSATPEEVPTRLAAEKKVDLSVVRGRGLSEVHQQFSDYARQIVRVRDGSPVVELEWTVGPVPINDGIGKEVISKFTSGLRTGEKGRSKFYTDSNGREFMERVFNYRPTWDLEVYEPIAGNYYPLTAAMYIQDTTHDQQLAVLTDRSQGGASLKSGEMELLIHRRLVVDDNRGVEEALNETTGGMSHYPDWIRSGDGITVTGKHYLLLSSISDGLKEVRTLMDELYLPLVPLFSAEPSTVKHFEALATAATTAGSAENKVNHADKTTVLGLELPVNVHLLTLEARSNKELLVRLAHQFAVGEDAALSAPVSVDLFQLLQAWEPVSAQEMTLSANQLKSEQLAGKIQWPTEASASTGATPVAASLGAEGKAEVKKGTQQLRGAANAAGSFVVELNPMQIKTFLVQLK
eukprot:gene11646-13532_t